MKRTRCRHCGKRLVKVPFVGWRHEDTGLQACADGSRPGEPAEFVTNSTLALEWRRRL